MKSAPASFIAWNISSALTAGMPQMTRLDGAALNGALGEIFWREILCLSRDCHGQEGNRREGQGLPHNATPPCEPLGYTMMVRKYSLPKELFGQSDQRISKDLSYVA